MNTGRETIEDNLYRAWKAERRFILLRGASRLLVWGVALIIADLLFDWQILSRTGIHGWVALLAVNLGVIGRVVWCEWLRYLKPYNPEIVALEVERKHPELSSLLISYIQLKDTGASRALASPALMEAMRKQAVLRTRPMDFREVVDFRQLRNLFIFAACAFMFFLAMNVGLPRHMAVLFRRLVGIDTAYPTRTQIVSITGDVTVKQGDSIEIKVKAGGKLPEAGQIRIRPRNDRTWRTLPLARKGDDLYVRTVTEVADALVYRVELGDARSKEFQILAAPPPEIILSKITMRYPDYLVENGAPDKAGSELNMEVPEGTSVRWELQVKPAVSSLRVTLAGKTLEAALSAGGTLATFEGMATNTFKYAFFWTEKEHGFTYDDVQHEVKVLADMAPNVDLVAPENDLMATTNRAIRIEARASDDHGLGMAELVYSLNGQPLQRERLRDLNGKADNLIHAWVPARGIPLLKSGDSLTFHLEVGDRRPPGLTHVTSSASRSVSIVSDEQYLDWWRNELNAQRDKIIQSRGDEARTAGELTRLKAEEKSVPAKGGAQ